MNRFVSRNQISARLHDFGLAKIVEARGTAYYCLLARAFFFEPNLFKHQEGQRPVFSLAFLARTLVPVLASYTQKKYKINPAYRTVEE